MTFALPTKFSLSQLTSSLTFPLLEGGGAEPVSAWGLVLAGLNQDSPFSTQHGGLEGFEVRTGLTGQLNGQLLLLCRHCLQAPVPAMGQPS